MSYQQVSTCPQCGAPIYVESPYWSIMPPAPRRTCACVGGSTQAVQTYTTTTTSGTVYLPQAERTEVKR